MQTEVKPEKYVVPARRYVNLARIHSVLAMASIAEVLGDGMDLPLLPGQKRVVESNIFAALICAYKAVGRDVQVGNDVRNVNRTALMKAVSELDKFRCDCAGCSSRPLVYAFAGKHYFTCDGEPVVAQKDGWVCPQCGCHKGGKFG